MQTDIIIMMLIVLKIATQFHIYIMLQKQSKFQYVCQRKMNVLLLIKENIVNYNSSVK